jgi:ribosomal protein L1
MKDEDISDNVKAIYNAIENALPTKKENVKNVMLKFTMTKPQGVRI